MAPQAGWTAVVPLKALPAAKSRLAASLAPAAASLPDAGTAHAALVRAMRADTLAAVRACRAVGRVVVIRDRADAPALGADDGLLTVVQRRAGLNGAVRDGAAHARRHWPHDGVVALVGDLPALTPAALEEVLVAAGSVARGFVPDRAGTGTTMITAAAGECLEPRFGANSAARHAQVAVALPAAAAARHDVDTLADLWGAGLVGLGPRTRTELARWDAARAEHEAAAGGDPASAPAALTGGVQPGGA